MNKYIKSLAFTGIFLLLVSTGAFALSVDFANSSFASESGEQSFSFNMGAVTVTVGAFDTNSNTAPYLTWYAEDGFGVHGSGSYEIDEIETPEQLRISFSSEVLLTNFYLTDLFIESRTSQYAENGQYAINGGAWINFFADTAGGNGAKTLQIDTVINSIWFTALGKTNGQDHEFSVKGFEIASVPEPAPLLLLGTGLIGLAGLGRKRLVKK